jgi:hypothetical protein
MTHEQLGERVAYWCGRLQMDPWRITTSVVNEPHGQQRDAVHASIGTASAYLYAELQFARKWVRSNPSDYDRDQTIVHELLHCLFRDLDKAAEVPYGALGSITEEVVEARYDHELEQLIDRLAHVIVTLDSE